MQHLNTQGRPIEDSQVKALTLPSGEVILTGTLQACTLAAARRGLKIGQDCLIQNVWGL